MLLARYEYIFGGSRGMSAIFIGHAEFLYLLFGVFILLLYFFNVFITTTSCGINILRTVSFVVFFSRASVVIQNLHNVVSVDLLFVHMYVNRSWWETVMTLTVSALVFLFASKTGAVLGRSSKNNSILVASILFICYTTTTMPFCNDFVTLFLTIELTALTSLVVVIGTCGARDIFRYIVFNVVSSVVIVLGILDVYGVVSFVDFGRLQKIISSTLSVSDVRNTGVFFILSVGVALKFFSIPASVVFQTIYTKLMADRLFVFLVIIKSSYMIVLIKLFVLIMCPKVISTFIALSAVSTMTAVFSGVAALRSRTLTGGIVYSSIQHVCFLVAALIISYNFNLSVSSSIFYFIVYVFTVASFVLTILIIEYALVVRESIVILLRSIIVALLIS